MKNMACRATLALAGVVLFSAIGLAANDIVVMKKDDVKHAGKVTRDDAKGVALRLKGGGQAEWGRTKVKEVIYDNEKPMEYKIGVERFRSERYEAALESLEAAMARKHHPLLRQYILYYIGLSSQKLGKLKKAVTAFEKLKAQGSKTRFLNEAVGSLVELELERNNPVAARKHLSEFKNIDRMQKKVLNARIAEKLGQYAAAARLYRTVAESGDAKVAEQAVLGGARCSMGQRRYEEAARLIRNFVKRERSEKMSAEAFVLLGDALKAQKKWEEAMLAYMRVPCLYAGDEATEAKALYWASRCFREMKAEKSAERAARLVAELKRRYPKSTWTRKVR